MNLAQTDLEAGRSGEAVISASEFLALLLDVGDLSEVQLERKGRDLYRELYLDNDRYGIRQTHDHQTLVFHANQFGHAFFTSSNKLCHPERKDMLRSGSIERIRWIEPLVLGQAESSACFEVPGPNGRYRPPNRLYAMYQHPFVVWLEPRKNSGWKFSSAYPCSIEEIHRYSRGGRTVWKWKKPHD